MPDRTDLQELGRKSTMRRKDLLRQLGLPEEELKAWVAGEAPILLEAFQMSLQQKGLALAATEEDAPEFTIALVSALCAAFDTGFEIGAALAADNA